ncbi:MAG: hypothetical protein NTX64_02260 [Elusimicrobia bacterium]|nr:hypothetical protein [Elusimicrobiota bacterium]
MPPLWSVGQHPFRRILPIAILALLSGWPSQGWANSSEISLQLDELTHNLTKGYKTRNPRVGKRTVAVLPFNCDSKLAKQRVGFALSELLTHHLVSSTEFTVVERADLSRVLEEQSLQMTGAIDTASAVKVGKLVGAELLVSGSVERLGDKYEVNARIIDAATGEVLTVGYQEMPGRLFEESASPYLQLHPEQQAVGLYFLANYRNNPNRLSAYNGTVTPGITNSVSPHSFTMTMIGGGVRYSPSATMMIDVSLAALPANVEYRHTQQTDKTINATYNVDLQQPIKSGSTFYLQATANWVHRFPLNLRGILGAGISYFKVGAAGDTFRLSPVPQLRGGLEYKLQERLGLACFLNYDLLTASGYDVFSPNDQNLRFSRFSVSPTIAVYF